MAQRRTPDHRICWISVNSGDGDSEVENRSWRGCLPHVPDVQRIDTHFLCDLFHPPACSRDVLICERDSTRVVRIEGFEDFLARYQSVASLPIPTATTTGVSSTRAWARRSRADFAVSTRGRSGQRIRGVLPLRCLCRRGRGHAQVLGRRECTGVMGRPRR